MGNQKQKWTQDEEDALIAGVEKHGAGKWKNILKDPQFAPFLTSRSNIDLKDKWRNLSVSNGTQGTKEKARTPKAKPAAPSTPVVGNAAATATVQNATPATVTSAALVTHQAEATDVAASNPPQNDSDSKNPSRYNTMIFEALAALKDANGSDLNAIVNFIEQKHQVPQNFRRALSTRLRRLVTQGKVEKVQNCYKIRKESSSGSKSPVLKQKDGLPHRQPPSPSGFVPSNELIMPSTQLIQEACEDAAHRIADAESKAHLAAEAVREAERIQKLAESSESMLKLAQKIYDHCARGEVVVLAA